jgi:hypothetical protein
MQRKTYEAITAKIEAIKADPIGWARQRMERVADIHLSGQPTRELSDDELREVAAKALAYGEATLKNAVIEEPQRATSKWANERARRAVENLES